MKLVNIGFGNMVNASRIISVTAPDSAPIRRMMQLAKDNGTLIDATCGRKTKSVIVADSDHIILSYLPPERIYDRFNSDENSFDDEVVYND